MIRFPAMFLFPSLPQHCAAAANHGLSSNKTAHDHFGLWQNALLARLRRRGRRRPGSSPGTAALGRWPASRAAAQPEVVRAIWCAGGRVWPESEVIRVVVSPCVVLCVLCVLCCMCVVRMRGGVRLTFKPSTFIINHK